MSLAHHFKGPMGQKTPRARSKGLHRVAEGKKSSSDCPIMRSAKGEACLADWCGCGGSNDTTAMRHVRKFKIAGAGEKPPNFIAFYGCDKAERMFERGVCNGVTWEGVCQALVLTQMKLVRKGLLRG